MGSRTCLYIWRAAGGGGRGIDRIVSLPGGRRRSDAGEGWEKETTGMRAGELPLSYLRRPFPLSLLPFFFIAPPPPPPLSEGGHPKNSLLRFPPANPEPKRRHGDSNGVRQEGDRWRRSPSLRGAPERRHHRWRGRPFEAVSILFQINKKNVQKIRSLRRFPFLVIKN